MTEEQNKKFQKWLEPHIKDHGHDFAGGWYITTTLGEHINLFSDRHTQWLGEMEAEWRKKEPPLAGMVYVPWKLEQRDDVNDINKEERSQAYARWQEEHWCCPKCGYDKQMQTLAGVVWHVGEEYNDNINTAFCTKCEWTGKVNELKPRS
jgi:hypothetical protein